MPETKMVPAFVLAAAFILSSAGAARADSVQVLEEGKNVSSPLALKFAETRECPKEFSELQKLKELSDLYDSKPFPVDLTELTVIPLDADAPGREGHLPLTCGYNLDSKQGGIGSSHCTDPGNCYFQAGYDLPKTHGHFIPLESKEINRYRLAPKELPHPSYHDGGDTGDLRFVPLGNGVYVQTFRNDDRVFFYGLVLVPSKESFDKLACEKNDWLARNRKMLRTSEIQDVQNAIRRLFMQGEALNSVRELTRYIEENKKQLPESAVARMRQEAKTLLDVVDGKEDLAGFKLGEHRCGGTPLAIEQDGPKKPGAQPNVDETKVVTAASRPRK